MHCPDALDDLVVLNTHATYDSFGFIPPHSQWTILAAFYLIVGEEVKLISLGTGTKCLPISKLSTRGEVVHDSHAEVLARRSALRWFFEEILRTTGTGESPWIVRGEGDNKFKLRDGVQLNLYISTLPCKHIHSLKLRLMSFLRRGRVHAFSGLDAGRPDGVPQRFS